MCRGRNNNDRRRYRGLPCGRSAKKGRACVVRRTACKDGNAVPHSAAAIMRPGQPGMYIFLDVLSLAIKLQENGTTGDDGY